MGQTTAGSPELALTVPRAGLTELFRFWTGDGPLLDALATCQSDDEVEWHAADIRRRSRRILLGLLADDLLALPQVPGDWLEHLPAESTAQAGISNSPTGGMRWADTVRQYGWPPTSYVSRRRSWSIDTLPLSVLTWVSRRLADVMADVMTLSPELHARLGASVAALGKAASQIAVDEDAGKPPDRSELLALGHSGFPWRTVANIAELISRSEHDPEFLAFSLLEPDPDLESRLFQVSILGYVVAALRVNHCRIIWKSSFGTSADGPQAEARSSEERQWDLWFDSGKSRAHYAAPKSAYSSATKSIVGTGQSVRPDILLIDYPNRALVIECKWSPDPSYVGRDGYHQASSYALDALNGLADEVWWLHCGSTGDHSNIEHRHRATILDRSGARLSICTVTAFGSHRVPGWGYRCC